MAVQVTCHFDLPLGAHQVWNALKNVSEVAGCFPGVTSVEAIDPRTCKGVVLVKLGPMQLEFAGQFAFVELDEAVLKASALARGQDRRGRGRAESRISLHVEPTEAGSRTTVSAETELSGTIAQFGRAKSVIQAVAETLVGEFAKALELKLAPAGEAPPPPDGGLVPAQTSMPARQNSKASKPVPLSGLGLAVRAFMQWWRRLFSRV